MHKWIISTVFFCMIFGLFYMAMPAKKADAAEKAVVAVDVLNVREGPSQSKPVIAKVIDGDTFTVLDERYGWLEIAISHSKKGWIAGQFTLKAEKEKIASATTAKNENDAKQPSQNFDGFAVTLLYNGTNLRSGPGMNYDVIARGNQGERYSIVNQSGDWIHVQLQGGNDAFVAGWIVTSTKRTHKRTHNSTTGSLEGKTIVIDPGHGGKDSGALGDFYGSLEKNLTLKTGKALASKLRNAGAHVVLTRSDDTFISLTNRVQVAKSYKADAFISLHYNASLYPNATGVTSYYYTKQKDRPLAQAIQEVIGKQTDSRNRGSRFADYHVLRENSQPATLLELGFLSNQWEEHAVRTSTYQENISNAIFTGIENYFDGKG